MTREMIRNILNTMSRNDNMCQGAPQQMANGFYRSVEMLGVMIRYLDKDNVYGSSVAAIEQLHERNETYCQSAPQQCANGVYRVVELLEVLVKVVAPAKAGEAAAVLSLMEQNESYCQSAPQQIANGSYRMAEMLRVLVSGCDRDLAAGADGVIAAMERRESLCQGAPQQSANGMDASALLVEMLARKVDKDGAYTATIDTISRIKDSNNSRCQGADQQSGNYLYRMLELGQVIADVFMDEEDAKAAKRLQEYWIAHAEEKVAFLKEKEELSAKIDEVEARAMEINDNKNISIHQDNIRKLREAQNGICNPEVETLAQEIQRQKEQRDMLSLFALRQRKEFNERIAGLNARKQELENVVAQQKAAVQTKIDAEEQQIEARNRAVEAKREAVRKEAEPFEKRIAAIDRELTRPR